TKRVPPDLRIMPHQRIQFAGPRPVFGLLDQIMTNRISPNIIPLLRVTIAASELAVPEILLPKGLIARMRPTHRGEGFPILHPPFQGSARDARRTKQMQVVGHDDVAAHEPGIRLLPGATQGGYGGAVRKDGFAVRRAHGEENDDGAVAAFSRRPMDRMFASRILRLHDDAHNNFPMSRRARYLPKLSWRATRCRGPRMSGTRRSE